MSHSPFPVSAREFHDRKFMPTVTIPAGEKFCMAARVKRIESKDLHELDRGWNGGPG